MPAGGVRPAAPPRHGAGGRGDDVLRQDRRDLVDGGDALTDDVAETLREWAGHARERGVAAIFEAAQLSGMGDRVLSWQGGERQMTDLAHMTQLLQEAAHREHFSLPALRDWLRAQREERSGATERDRRLDNDAAAVQIMTVWVAKGLQFPVVYLPFAFNRNVQDRELVLFHDGDQRCLHVGGSDSPDFNAVSQAGPRRGRQRRQPADLCGDDARAVAGGGVVGAVDRTNPTAGCRGCCAGAARVRPRCRIAVRRTKISDDDAMARLHGVGGGRRPGHRGVGGAARCLRCRRGAAEPISARGTSTARSTPRGGGRRTRV